VFATVALLASATTTIAAKATPPGIATIQATCSSVTINVDPRVFGSVYQVKPVVKVDGAVIDPTLSSVTWYASGQGEIHPIEFPMYGQLPFEMHPGRNHIGLKMFWTAPGAPAKSTAHAVVTCA
jgi:hypothetical protein